MFARAVGTKFCVAHPVHAHLRLYVVTLVAPVAVYSLEQSHFWPSYLLLRWVVDLGTTGRFS